MYARLGMLVLAVAVSVVTPARTDAQQAPSASHSVSKAGPRLELTATAMHRPVVADSAVADALFAKRQNMGKPVALMIVGGAAFLAGAIIGGDAGTIFMIGGAVTGLIGLFQYLQ
jgi:hypothetical protein